MNLKSLTVLIHTNFRTMAHLLKISVASVKDLGKIYLFVNCQLLKSPSDKSGRFSQQFSQPSAVYR